MDPLDVKEVLEKHRHEYLYYDDNSAFRITVRRSSIWDDALRAVKRALDEKKLVRVTFIGESAVDGGGPRREFFMLLMNAIRENNSLLDGPLTTRVLRHNTTALQNELYLCMGKMIALSIVHGVQAHHFLPSVLSITSSMDLDQYLLELCIFQMQVSRNESRRYKFRGD